MSDLFANSNDVIPASSASNTASIDDKLNRPLADQLRPNSLQEVVGQDHICGPDGSLTRMIASNSLGSMIFWGPPGSGKTTIARLLTNHPGLVFQQISAIFSGVADLKKHFEAARKYRQLGKITLLFVDEIHRFNRAQLDSFLPVMEDGTIILVGATTQNPSFELNAALLSRAQVLTFNSHTSESLTQLLGRAEELKQQSLPLDETARASLIKMSDGDGRAVLGLAEEVWRMVGEGETWNAEKLQEMLHRRAPIYDKGQDGHYNLISALHKAVRGSDPDASLYYLARILDAGEDRRFIARRLVRMASEDIGNADPQALVVAIAAKDSFDFLGMPEGDLALAQACIYLATAPKSNAVYVAYKAAMRTAKSHGSLRPPKHILNAPTELMKDEGYSKGYRYDHDEDEAFSGQNYFPEEMDRQQFYQPPDRGFERDINKRLAFWKKMRDERSEE